MGDYADGSWYTEIDDGSVNLGKLISTEAEIRLTKRSSLEKVEAYMKQQEKKKGQFIILDKFYAKKSRKVRKSYSEYEEDNEDLYKEEEYVHTVLRVCEKNTNIIFDVDVSFTKKKNIGTDIHHVYNEILLEMEEERRLIEEYDLSDVDRGYEINNK